MATIRDCFLVDISFCNDLKVIYCTSFRNLKNQLKKHKKSFVLEVPNLVDKIIYTSGIVMDLRKAIKKHRKAFIPPNIPKFRVES